MTSAALADCNGATSDSASKAKAKRTVFMNRSDSKGHSRDRDFNTNGVIKYRPRMKDLRRSGFAVQQNQNGGFIASDIPALRRQERRRERLTQCRELARHYRRRLDLDPRCLFNKTHDLDQRHGGIMRAEDVAIDLAECLQVRQIFFHIDDIPG